MRSSSSVTEIQLDDQQKADLLWFVHDVGKGFVSTHTGTTTFMSWPEFGQLIGGGFDEHPWGIIEAPVIVEDPKFPGMGSLGTSFTIKDEFYQQKDFSPEHSRVLLRLDMSKLDMTRRGVKAEDARTRSPGPKCMGRDGSFTPPSLTRPQPGTTQEFKTSIWGRSIGHSERSRQTSHRDPYRHSPRRCLQQQRSLRSCRRAT